MLATILTAQRFQDLLDHLAEGCQVLDHNFRYLYLNKAAAYQGKRTQEELVGHSMMEMYPGIDKTELFGHIKDCLGQSTPHKMENEFTFPDGSKGWFELRIESIPEGVLIISSDIT